MPLPERLSNGGMDGGGVKSQWPTSTGLCCWNCTEPFETRPVFLPYYFHERKNLFHTRGVFCSFPCMKRYNADRNHGATVQRVSALISFMYKRLNGSIDAGVHMAPPTAQLAKFGGCMTISQYRANRLQCLKTVAPVVTLDICSSQLSAATPPLVPKPTKKKQSDVDPLEVAANKIKNASKATAIGKTDSLRLKRQKRMESNSGNRLMSQTLLNTLGIEVDG